MRALILLTSQPDTVSILDRRTTEVQPISIVKTDRGLNATRDFNTS
jgi:hypothetical protein